MLQHIGLSANQITENTPANTVIATLLNTTAGVTPVLANDGGGRLALTGPDGGGLYHLVAGATNYDFDTYGPTISIQFSQTNAGYGNSPLNTSLTLQGVNVYEQPFLGALSLSATTFVKGTPSSGVINGATSGSSIGVTGLPAGLTINSAARTWNWDGTGALGSGNLVLTETLADSPNSGRQSTIGWTVNLTLGALTLSSTTFTPSVPASGTINGATTGSTITAQDLPQGLTIDPVARTWSWDGTGVASTGNLKLTETLQGATNSGRISTIGWTISSGVTLNALSFDASDWVTGTPASGNILGATAGSTISITGAPTGLTISSTNRTWAWDGVGDGAAHAADLFLNESLSGATNNNRQSPISYTISVSPLSAGTLAFDTSPPGNWTTGQNPPALLLTLPPNGSIGIGDFYRFKVNGSSFSAWHKITTQDYANSFENGGFKFAWGSELPVSGLTSFSFQFGRGADAQSITQTSGDSNTISDTLRAKSATITLTHGVGTGTGSFDKSKYLNVPLPDLQMVTTGGVGSNLFVRGTKPVANDKSHLEWECSSFRTGSNTACFFGIDAREQDFNNGGNGVVSGTAWYPGNGVKLGFLLKAVYGSSQISVYHSGTGNPHTLTIPASVTGGMSDTGANGPDRIALDMQMSTRVVDVNHIRPGPNGTATITHIGSFTPSAATLPAAGNWWPIAGGLTGNGTIGHGQSDAVAMKPDTTQWLMTTPGYGIIG